MGATTEGTRETQELEREAAEIREDRARLRVTETALEARTKALLSKMPADATVREMADLVGLSHQRVAQILPGRAPRGRRAKPAVNTPPVGGRSAS